MVDTRLVTAALGLAAGLAISVVAWVLWETLLLFLFLPFIPLFAFRGGTGTETATSQCPVCGYRTRDPEFEYCPRDGHRLEEQSGTEGL